MPGYKIDVWLSLGNSTCRNRTHDIPRRNLFAPGIKITGGYSANLSSFYLLEIHDILALTFYHLIIKNHIGSTQIIFPSEA